MVGYRERFYVNFILFLLISFLKGFVSGEYKVKIVPEDVIPDLYLKYKEAISDDKTNTSSHRLFKNDKQYEIHVKKLKDVNGFKVHNLMIKENLRTEPGPLIYIINPVESKIPKAYLTLEEFKNVLTNRVMKQRNELTTKDKRKIFKIRPKKIDVKQTTSDKKLYNKMKTVNVTNTSNVNLTTNLAKLDTDVTSLTSIIINKTSTKVPITVEVHTNNDNLTTTELESVLDSITGLSSIKLYTPTMKHLKVKVHTDSTIKRTKQEEETVHSITKQLDEINSDSIKLSDNDLATTLKFYIANKSTDNNEDKTILDIEKQFIITSLQNTTEKILETTGIYSVINNIHKILHEPKKEVKNNKNDTLITEYQSINTTLGNVTENVLVTTTIENNSISNKDIQELNKEANNKESEIKLTTDIKRLQDENVNTVHTTTVKEKPRRKTTMKLSQVSKGSVKPLKRSTLGRPLVFMGNR